MTDQIFGKIDEMLEAITQSELASAEELEQWRIKYVGAKNIIKPLFSEIRNVPNERKKEFGQRLNSLKEAAEKKFQELKANLSQSKEEGSSNDLDLTLPPGPLSIGSRHPVTLVMEHMIEVF